MEFEGIGKNIEQAIENALFELKATRDDVDIKILEEGGLFKKAKVLVSISEDAIDKYKKREEKRKELLAEENTNEEKIVDDSKIETASEKMESKNDMLDQHENKSEKSPKTEKKEAKINENSDNTLELARSFVGEFLNKANITAEIDYSENDEEVFIKITGEQATTLIGYRGDSLNALQYIISSYTSKNNRKAKKIRLDINDFRVKREQTLIALAERIAKKVEKTHHQCKLEPMSANERRIIHTALQSNEFVTTTSRGEEPRRYLVVMPKEDMIED